MKVAAELNSNNVNPNKFGSSLLKNQYNFGTSLWEDFDPTEGYGLKFCESGYGSAKLNRINNK